MFKNGAQKTSFEQGRIKPLLQTTDDNKHEGGDGGRGEDTAGMVYGEDRHIQEHL